MAPTDRCCPSPSNAETSSQQGVSPASNSFRHEALAWAADDRRSDLGGAVIRRWRKATVTQDSNAMLAAAFTNGDPFLATRGYGRGRCAVATCAFDARAGNLPGRAAFVPLVHELVAWAAGGGVNLNVESAWSPSFVLDSRSSGGLAARYCRQKRQHRKSGVRQDSLLDRIDPAIDFNWTDKTPGPTRAARQFLRPVAGRPAAAGQRRIPDRGAGRRTHHRQHRQQDGPGTSVRPKRRKRAGCASRPANRSRSKRFYEQQGGPAVARLFWTPPGGVRQIIPSAAWIPAGDDDPPVLRGHRSARPHPQGHRRASAAAAANSASTARPCRDSIRSSSRPTSASSIAGMPVSPLPVVVRGDIAESRLDPLDDADLAQLRARTDVILPQSTADVLAVLSGRGFGREITRTVAVAALAPVGAGIRPRPLGLALAPRRRRIDASSSAMPAPTPFAKGGWR